MSDFLFPERLKSPRNLQNKFHKEFEELNRDKRMKTHIEYLKNENMV